MILKILLTSIGWPRVMWKDLVTVGSLVVGVACLWVAVEIYHRQDQAAKKAHEQLKAFIKATARIILRTLKQPMTPEIEAELERFAEATAGTINQVIQMPTLRGGGTLRDPRVEAELERFAEATAGTIINQVIQMPTLRGGATLYDPKVVTNANLEEDKK